MNKSESKEVAKVIHAYRAGYCDAGCAARSLSALCLAARTDLSIRSIKEAADAIGVQFHPEFRA